MAMGGRGQREATSAIASCRPFRNSTGSFYGTRGSTRTLGWLEVHPDARRIRELLNQSTYVVWSYGTPLGCVTENEDGNITKWYFDVSHSATTSHHQTLVRVGFSDFETVGDGPWSRSTGQGRRDHPRRATSPDAMRRRAEVDAINARTREWAEAARQEPTAAHVYGALADQRFRTDHRGVRYDSRVERDTSFERDMVEARQREARIAAMETGRVRAERDYMTPGERDGRPTREQMLDPRYGDPDWTPWSTFHGNLPEGADERDRERVEREGLWQL